MTESPQHQCFVYQGAPSSHLADISRTLVEKLNTNHRCLYLNSRPMVAGMRWHLSSQGIDLAQHEGRRALIISSDQDHLEGGKFDVGRMIALLDEAMKQALADGFAGLWASGDMTWEFGSEENLDKLLEYERALEAYMRRNSRLSGICLYHRDTLPSQAIETALITHPVVYRNASLSEINPHYYENLRTGT